MTRRYTFTAVLVPQPESDGGGYVAHVPALRGCVTEGNTVRETLQNIRDAATCWIRSVRRNEFPLPANRPPDARTVRTAQRETTRGLLVRTHVKNIRVTV